VIAGSGLHNDVIPWSCSFCRTRRGANACADRRAGRTAYYATRRRTSASADCRAGRRILRH